MAKSQRARNAEDKLARRAAILQETQKLLQGHDFSQLTMAQIARACSLAKGTLYLYFRSKQEVFLALVERELNAWFGVLQRGFDSDAQLSAERFGEFFAASVTARPTLRQLLVVLHAILERNVTPTAAVAFKETLRDRLVEGGATLEQLFPALPSGQGVHTLRRIYGLMVGLEQMASHSTAITDVLARDDMRALRVDFEKDLAAGVASMLRGAQTMGVQHLD